MSQLVSGRHTKIVCTLGPASSSSEILEKMLRAGMDIARLNLAYSTFEEHSRIVAEVRRLSRELELPTGILFDLPGPKRFTGDTRAVFGPQLEFALSQQADFIAVSFISTARQVEAVKELLREAKVDTPLIVKIEKAQGLAECEAILDKCEGIMVARGDLALEISIEKVPLAQKRLIKEANCRGKPVITATEMLLSMVQSPTPSRAEATDVANAVLDGTDAVMLSQETSVGQYPVAAIETMAKIALEAETAFPYQQVFEDRCREDLPEVNDATARAACQIAQQIQASAIVAFTTGGTTAFRVSKYRPRQPILAVTPSEITQRHLSVIWGVIPIKKPGVPDLEGVFSLASKVALETGIARTGEFIVITTGLPLGVPGSTNLVKVHRV